MKDHSGLKNITIVIPVRPDDIPEKSIASVGKMDYPAELMEVLIAEGWFPSLQRNEAVKKAKGDIVYFLDDDSDAPPDTLIKAVKHLNDSGADVVGGPSLTPDTDTFIQKCFALMFASPFGGFNIRHRHKKSGKYRSATERELISCNLAIKRDVFLRENGLRGELFPNEENEFLDRLTARKYKLFYDPEMYVHRSQRKGIWRFFKQIFTYGRGRMDQTLMNPVFIKLYHFVPMLFVIYLASIPFADNYFYLMPLFAYSALSLFFSGISALEARRLACFFIMPIVFAVCHIAYGMGSIWGILKKILKIEINRPSREIIVREMPVKRLGPDEKRY
ncbi:MAG TPA: glycosyltransferase [bacterium]